MSRLLENLLLSLVFVLLLPVNIFLLAPICLTACLLKSVDDLLRFTGLKNSTFLSRLLLFCYRLLSSPVSPQATIFNPDQRCVTVEKQLNHAHNNIVVFDFPPNMGQAPSNYYLDRCRQQMRCKKIAFMNQPFSKREGLSIHRSTIIDLVQNDRSIDKIIFLGHSLGAACMLAAVSDSQILQLLRDRSIEVEIRIGATMNSILEFFIPFKHRAGLFSYLYLLWGYLPIVLFNWNYRSKSAIREIKASLSSASITECYSRKDRVLGTNTNVTDEGLASMKGHNDLDFSFYSL